MAQYAVVMDVDTGTDDALALLYAAQHPEIDLLAVSCVAGNASLERVVDNTLKVLDAAGAGEVPVAGGARQPLVERARQEGHFHGEDGLGGVVLPATPRVASELSAVELLRRTIVASGEAGRKVTLVALAPQTNVALLLAQHPEVGQHLERILFMGGSASVGNITAVAEFNVWQDPEAATATVESGLPVAMYGLDVFLRLTVDRPHADRYLAADHPAQRLTGELLFLRGRRAAGEQQDYLGLIGDAGALVYLTDPQLFTVAAHPTRVNLTGIGRGQTVVDRRPYAQDAQSLAADPWPVVDVVLDLDVAAAADAFTAVVDSFAP